MATVAAAVLVAAAVAAATGAMFASIAASINLYFPLIRCKVTKFLLDSICLPFFYLSNII